MNYILQAMMQWGIRCETIHLCVDPVGISSLGIKVRLMLDSQVGKMFGGSLLYN